MEILDLYDKDGNKLNRTIARGAQLNKDEYYIGVDVWIKNDKGQILLTQRHPSKYYPLKWECTSGCITAGEDSLTGAIREVEEETGIKLNKIDGNKISRIIFHNQNLLRDVFLFKNNMDIKLLRLQDGEVINAKWVEKSEIKEMYSKNEMNEMCDYVYKYLEDGII
jgi:isopentenyldiphosphate isomerase